MNRRLSLALAAVLSLVASLTSAQVSTTGTVTVVVEATDGSRLPGASVTIEAGNTTSKKSGVTNSQGEVTFLNLAPSPEYVVTTQLAGFNTAKNERILVSSGQTTAMRVGLAVASATEEVTVTADSPLVDTKSAIAGQDITLELTESLPTSRTYQGYLELVPGVSPSDPTAPGNPASKSGINYSDIRGDIGQSSDNAYYLDGINVTDPVTGTFGANMNTEVIQELKAITGGIPAEFVGTPGILSNVVTKSGSNTWRGSVNYFRQSDGLVGDNEHLANSTFSTYDYAATLGGPVVKDKLWAFGSYRRVNRDEQIVSQDTQVFLRDVARKDKQWYGKGTWSPSNNDTLSFTFMTDPTNVSGRREATIPNSNDRARTQGGNRYNGLYTRVFGGAAFEVGYAKHNGEVTDESVIREGHNTVVFRTTDVRTQADQDLGGWGSDLIDQRDTRIAHANLQWNMAAHTLKVGAEYATNENFRNSLTIGDTKALYTSLNPGSLSGFTAQQIADANDITSLQFDVTNPSDFNGLITTINGLPNRAAFYGAFDLNHDGTISAAELGQALVFNSTAGNPDGKVNYYRIAQVADGPQVTKSKGLTFFVQDTATFGNLTVNAGARAEQWKHFDTLGESIYAFDWTIAPRISAAYDLKGDGKQRISAYFGRYFDPIRNNMTNFAGSHSGRTQEQQVFILGQWVNYRTRGGASLDAIFAPATKTPYTDDLKFDYAIDLGRNMRFSAAYSKRWTRNILEDYDPGLYSVPALYPGPVDDPNSLFLPYESFGFPASGLPGVANFFIGTLAGSKRDYQGIDLVFNRRFADRWQALLWYSWNDFKGNSNSDSNADFQGDVIWLDPRAPNVYGPQPGTIHHLLNASGSYQLPMGLQFGTTLRWNSGTLASRTASSSGRNLPIRVATEDAFLFAGILDRWVQPNAVGALTNPSAFTADFRVEYVRNVGQAKAELFVDIFNVLDNQNAIRNQDLVAGAGATSFGSGLVFREPRRFFLGARLSF